MSARQSGVRRWLPAEQPKQTSTEYGGRTGFLACGPS